MFLYLKDVVTLKLDLKNAWAAASAERFARGKSLK
jgi:hypothetical protein